MLFILSPLLSLFLIRLNWPGGSHVPLGCRNSNTYPSSRPAPCADPETSFAHVPPACCQSATRRWPATGTKSFRNEMPHGYFPASLLPVACRRRSTSCAADLLHEKRPASRRVVLAPGSRCETGAPG